MEYIDVKWHHSNPEDPIRSSTLTKTDPAVLKKNGPSKCAGSSTAHSVVDLGMQLASTINDDTRGSSRVMFPAHCPEHLNAGNTDCDVRGVTLNVG